VEPGIESPKVRLEVAEEKRAGEAAQDDRQSVRGAAPCE
jgi:hypothetical protein